ncbi:MAG: DUF4491 family protein [Actinobacteria bacterium]|nr:DUF4491 family protein [Actinomycetota bacterium]
MADIDVLLSASLKRIAQPGDAAGVADAIRARVDAGDTGTPATSSGFGSRPWWLFLLSGLLVILVAVTGVSVALGQPNPVTPTPDAASVAVSPSPTTAPTLTPTPTATPTATAAPEPAPAPAEPDPEPAPPADTTAPVVDSVTWSSTIYSANGGPTTIAALATDDTGVVAVAISWAGWATGSASMAPGWSYTLDPPPGPPVFSTVTFTVQAFDAAGNASAPVSVVVPVQP